MKGKEESEKVYLKLSIPKTNILASCPITPWQIDGKHWQFFSPLGSKITKMVTAPMKLKYGCSLEKSYEQPRQHIKKQRCYFATKVHIVKAMFSW